ncbi:subtilisin-like protein [Tilletiaria anomala UBC 951]|uniref:tripeptidyl-peptidase II n=1 Tax=Tilletiaria anomala (strain ATCC 24038 / CBS 436.72 / UBC 951) TaxID=1037660 RepID=A0A066VRF0_TILAU|nr:subtilisin-like protein [Tilletiaria anomala UBC 951]KDN41339.1 subtilisin-like protein [Tilletiaria anomala UBC 951]
MHFASFIALSLALASSASVLAAPQPRGVGNVVLPAPAIIPAAWKQVGVSNLSAALQITLPLKGANQDALEARMIQIAQSGGAWLTPEELATYATPAPADIAAVKSFLAANGVPASAIALSKNSDLVTVQATVEQVSKMFGNVQLYDFEFKGKTFRRAKQVTIPASIANVVQDVSPLTAFQTVMTGPARKSSVSHVVAAVSQANSNATVSNAATAATAPSSCTSASPYVTPQCLRDLMGTSSYQPAPVSGQVDVTVLGFIGQYVSQVDLTGFLTAYRPDAASYQIPIKNAAGGQNDPTNPGVEAMLDVEYVVAQNYPLNTEFLYYGSLNGDIFQQAFNYIYTTYTALPGVITVSYGDLESSYTSAQASALCSTAQKLTAQGTTILFASGDNGVDAVQSSSAPSCSSGFHPTYPSGCQYILSIGGTQNFGPERATDPSLTGGFYSGGGFSNAFTIPSFQKSAVSTYLKALGSTSSGYYNKNGRGFPDVAAQAANYIIEQGGQFAAVSGTSAAAPTFAALLSLLNDARRAAGKARLGWVHPALYGTASTLSDITTGQTKGCPSPQQNLGFPTKSGWDPVTGLGTATGKFSALRSLFGV